MIKCPCYKCEDREVGCHGKCQKPEYLQYEEKKARERQLIKEGRAYDTGFMEGVKYTDVKKYL